MIRTVDEFRRVQAQIGGLAESVAELKATVYSRNPEKYARIAQPYLEDIRRLEEFVTEYLSLNEVEQQQVDVRLRMLGPAARLGFAPASLLSKTIDKFTKSVRSVFIHNIRPMLAEPEVRRNADRLCEFSIAALLPGSLQVALNVPLEPTLFEGRTLLPKLHESIRLLLNTALLAEAVDFEERLARDVEDTVLRKVILYQAESISPRRSTGVEVIEFYGKLVHLDGTPRFTAGVRRRIKEILARPRVGEIESTIGSIRELDLDKRSFHLRHRERGLPPVRCSFFEGLLDEAVHNFGKRVRVTGRVLDRADSGEFTSLQVEAIESFHEE